MTVKFIKLPAGTGGFSWEGLLPRLFPPRITPIDRDGLKDVLSYQYRITRRGMDHNPAMAVGGRIISVRVGSRYRGRRFREQVA